jgi:MFS family permease
MLSDHVRDRRSLLSVMALIGLIGAAALPLLAENWLLMATVLLFWGGCVAGLYTVGLSHLGSRLHGADLAAANAAFIFCYAVGTVAGPQAIGAAMDVAGTNGFAWAIVFFFGLYVALSLARMVFRPKRA